MKILTRQRGFTLFEMVIAVSIFALMGVVAFGGLGQMTRTGASDLRCQRSPVGPAIRGGLPES